MRRTAAVIAATLAALAATPIAQAQPTADAQPSVDAAAAGWLARQLVAGDHLEYDGAPDPGTTLDALFAFSASGVAADSADRVVAWFADPGNTAGYLSFGDPNEAYAGAHGKLALAVQVAGEDPTDFAGVDLIARLGALQGPTGRFSDKSQHGDWSNNFGQAFAVLALARWDAAPEKAVDYLAGTRCEDGGFPVALETTPCVPTVDATAMAVQALLAAGETTEAAEGLDWLAEAQQPGGGFRDAGRTDEGNANSTGLAAQALRVGGRTEEADRAAAFLASLRVGCGAAEADRGAIAFDRTGFKRVTSLKASAQGALGLVGVGFAELSAEGAAAGAPVLDCPITTPPVQEPPVETTTTTTTTTTTPAAVAVGGGPELARTGVPVGPALWLGSLLLAAGASALVLARKRHATAEVRK